jgi:hypothetical protein
MIGARYVKCRMETYDRHTYEFWLKCFFTLQQLKNHKVGKSEIKKMHNLYHSLFLYRGRLSQM